ncbi:MAG: YkgJ family cysteine cluster protein [Candidatus Sericytochromatia bacterium]
MVLTQPPLYFGCNQCGACCRNFFIPLSHIDMLRLLAAHPELPLDGLFQLRPAKAEHAQALLLEGGWWQLVLKHRGDDCIFLDHEGRCGSYESRPRACRTFPFELAPTGLLQIVPDGADVWEHNCDRDPVTEPMIARSREENILSGTEFAAYCALVACWNGWAAQQAPEHQTLPGFFQMMQSWTVLPGKK